MPRKVKHHDALLDSTKGIAVMRSAVARTHINRRAQRRNQQEAAQNNGAELTPPSYGIDIADQASAETTRSPSPVQTSAAPATLRLVTDAPTQLVPQALPGVNIPVPVAELAPPPLEAAAIETPEVAPAEQPAADIELLMPEPPEGLSSADQQHLQSSVGRARAETRSQENLPAAGENVSQARHAVQEPVEETAARANAGLAAALGEQPQPSPEIEALCSRILQAIRDRRPPDEDSLLETNPREEADAAGSTLQSSVESSAEGVENNYQQLNDSPQGTPQQQAQSIDTPAASVNTGDLGAGQSVPEAVPDENVSLDADVDASAGRMQEAGMNSAPAELVQSGPIADARAAQGELSETAARDPSEVLAEQQTVRDSARSDMVALQNEALAALQSNRAQTVAGIGTRQQGMVESEQQTRTRISNEAQSIFNSAQTRVNNLLEPLTRTATERWETGVEVLSTQFETDLARIERWKQERHSGVGGAIVGVWDSVVGLPDWMIESYNRAERNFGQGVCRLLREISIEVNGIIATCESIIETANRDIAGLFNGLPAGLETWAAGEQARFTEQLDGLHERVTSTRDDFNRDLSERASQSVQEVRERIHELRQAGRGLVGRVADAIEAFIEDPAKFILEGLLELVGIPVASFWALVNRIQSVINDIADDPMGFANNLAAALGQGFQQFFDHFRTHIIGGFFDWLFSGLGAVGVQLPSDFSPASLITFFLQLMGITWENIREILARHIGEENVELIEKAYELISMLIEQGPAGIFEMIKEQLNPLAMLAAVMDAAIDFLIEALIRAVTPRIIAMFNPAGAIIQAIEVIYRILAWIFNNAARIFTLIETVVNGAAELIAGNFTGMATAVEGALARIIAPVIDFLAGFLGLGNLPDQIADTIRGFQQMVLGVIERVVAWLAQRARGLLQALGIGQEEDLTEDEGDEYASGLQDLDLEPVSPERSMEEKNQHLQRVHHILDLICNSADTTDDIQSYFPKIIRRYRLKTLEYEKAGNEQLGILIEINPTSEFTNFPGSIKVKANDGEEALSSTQNAPIIEDGILKIKMPGGNEVTNRVGRHMTAEHLGPNHPMGSETNGSELSGLFGVDGLPTSGGRSGYSGNEVFIRGHLLNADLGGPAEDRNLFPITQKANSQHLHSIEAKAKELVNTQGLLVKYEVQVKNEDMDLSDGRVNSDFECEMSTYTLEGGRLTPGSGKIKVRIRSSFRLDVEVVTSIVNNTGETGERQVTVTGTSAERNQAIDNALVMDSTPRADTSNVNLIPRRSRSSTIITELPANTLAGLISIDQREAQTILSSLRRRNIHRFAELKQRFGLTDEQVDLLRNRVGLYRRGDT